MKLVHGEIRNIQHSSATGDRRQESNLIAIGQYLVPWPECSIHGKAQGLLANRQTVPLAQFVIQQAWVGVHGLDLLAVPARAVAQGGKV
jgi:hypothetical protein